MGQVCFLGQEHLFDLLGALTVLPIVVLEGVNYVKVLEGNEGVLEDTEVEQLVLVKVIVNDG